MEVGVHLHHRVAGGDGKNFSVGIFFCAMYSCGRRAMPMPRALVPSYNIQTLSYF
jgi:hypothetical protein